MNQGEFLIPAGLKRRPLGNDAATSGSGSNSCQRQTTGPSSSQFSSSQQQTHTHYRQQIPEIATTQASDVLSQEYFEGAVVYTHPQKYLQRTGGGGYSGIGGPSSSQQLTQPVFDATQPVANMGLSYNPQEDEDALAEEAALNTPFAYLVGQQGLGDVVLLEHDTEWIFGASDRWNFKLPHNKIGVNPTDDKYNEPWFRLYLKNRNPPVVYLEDLSGFGTYLDGRKVDKPMRVKWGATISGSASPAANFFRYTFKNVAEEAHPPINGSEATYLVGDKVGQGMYSIVREVMDERDHTKKYACKDIDKSVRDYTSVELECIQHEINILKSLDHENIIKFVDECKEGPHIYIITEYVNGQTLHEYYRHEYNYLTEVGARTIIKQVCSALQYMHRCGIVHRDIKSENVMVTTDLKVKLIDFGLARSLSVEKPLITLCGTYAYMAPETAQADYQNSYSTPVDVWSVGILLFRMVAGRYPFNDTSDSSDDAAALSPSIEETKSEHLKFEQAKLEEVDTTLRRAAIKKEQDAEYKPTVNLNDINSGNSSDEDNRAKIEETALGIKTREKVWGRKVDYSVNWMKHVDDMNRRTDQLKDILRRFLTIDPSKRITMLQALNHYWMRMNDEQLQALEDQVSRRVDSTKLDDLESAASSDVTAPWGRMELIPGSIEGAPEMIALHKDKTYFGRYKTVDVHLGNDRFLSSFQCMIQHENDGRIVLIDNGMNATHINNLKIGRGMSCQIYNEDIIGFITPPDDDGEHAATCRPRNSNQRFLKYRLLINNAPEAPVDQIARGLIPRTDPVMTTRSKNLRLATQTRIAGEQDLIRAKAEANREPNTGEWGWLEPINQHTKKVRLVDVVYTIGRDAGASIRIDNICISRNHARLTWEPPRAYLDDLSHNQMTVNGKLVGRDTQLRDGDKIHVSVAEREEDDIGYIFYYSAENDFLGPPAKRSRKAD